MDVVRRNIQDLGGRISLKSERGRGMTIQLALPLTLAVMDGMVIKVGRETYVMPMSAIVECLRRRAPTSTTLLGTRGMLQLRGNLVPLVHLCDLLDIAAHRRTSEERVVIITDAGDGTRFGLVVDELCGHQQVVVKSIEESYGSVPGIRRRDNSRQRPGRAHSGRRKALRSRGSQNVAAGAARSAPIRRNGRELRLD